MIVDKWLYGEKKDGLELKEMKVKVPIEFHIKLHGLKLLKNQSISRSVELALSKYFTELEGTPLESTAAIAAALSQPLAPRM